MVQFGILQTKCEEMMHLAFAEDIVVAMMDLALAACFQSSLPDCPAKHIWRQMEQFALKTSSLSVSHKSTSSGQLLTLPILPIVGGDFFLLPPRLELTLNVGNAAGF